MTNARVRNAIVKQVCEKAIIDATLRTQEDMKAPRGDSKRSAISGMVDSSKCIKNGIIKALLNFPVGDHEIAREFLTVDAGDVMTFDMGDGELHLTQNQSSLIATICKKREDGVTPEFPIVVIQGPPGTAKTTMSIVAAKALNEENPCKGEIKLHQWDKETGKVTPFQGIYGFAAPTITASLDLAMQILALQSQSLADRADETGYTTTPWKGTTVRLLLVVPNNMEGDTFESDVLNHSTNNWFMFKDPDATEDVLKLRQKHEQLWTDVKEMKEYIATRNDGPEEQHMTTGERQEMNERIVKKLKAAEKLLNELYAQMVKDLRPNFFVFTYRQGQAFAASRRANFRISTLFIDEGGYASASATFAVVAAMLDKFVGQQVIIAGDQCQMEGVVQANNTCGRMMQVSILKLLEDPGGTVKDAMRYMSNESRQDGETAPYILIPPQVRSYLLKEQFRQSCIGGEYTSHTFYNHLVVSGFSEAKCAEMDFTLSRLPWAQEGVQIAYLATRGPETDTDATSRANEYQTQGTVNLCVCVTDVLKACEPYEIRILTGYSGEANALEEALIRQYHDRTSRPRACTVDSFQGAQERLIICVTVRTSDLADLEKIWTHCEAVRDPNVPLRQFWPDLDHDKIPDIMKVDKVGNKTG